MGAGRRHGGLGPSRKGVGSIEVPDAGLALAAQKGNGDRVAQGWDVGELPLPDCQLLSL